MPLPRATTVAIVLVVLAASAHALPGAVHMIGQASSFALTTGGVPVKGGLATWSFACTDCDIRLTLTLPDIAFVLQDGTAFLALPPGAYAISGFSGYAAYTYHAPYQMYVELHGTGRWSVV